jgi:hypothetical protein
MTRFNETALALTDEVNKLCKGEIPDEQIPTVATVVVVLALLLETALYSLFITDALNLALSSSTVHFSFFQVGLLLLAEKLYNNFRRF